MHPVGRWIWLMRDLAGPAQVSGTIKAAPAQAVQFREISSGKLTQVAANPGTGAFRTSLAEGDYEVKTGGLGRLLRVLPGESYSLNLTAEKNLDLKMTSGATATGEVTIRLTVSGAGQHTFALRTDNLDLRDAEQSVDLKPGVPRTIVWNAKAASAGAPWIAVMIPDHDFAGRRELTGRGF